MSRLDFIYEKMNPPVFFGSAIIIITFVSFGTLFTEQARSIFNLIQGFIVSQFGWFYIGTATTLLVTIIWLVFSRFGDIRLGGDDARPEFGYVSWFAMLMSAGMGIGIVFFGVAEPLQHYLSPPAGVAQQADHELEAMRYTFFHWGLHPWAIYCALALPLAYFHFRHKLPLAPRSLLYPLIGDRIHGPIGHAVDILCTVGTLFGVATSLGLGSLQINAGLNEIMGVPQNRDVQISLIIGITLIATISVVSGLHLGIRYLSQFNMSLAGIILLFFLVFGPTVYIIELFISSLGYYLQQLPVTSLWINTDTESDWQAKWTIFYWSWWISWSPFVGVFVARISKGRTIREFILTTLLVPSLIGFLWFSAVGGTGMYFQSEGITELATVTSENSSLSLYVLLRELPWASISSLLVTVLILIFFVTSSDSGSLVDDMVTSGGHPNPPRIQRVFWAVSEGAVAAALLLAGGLQALRTASLTTGLPMAIFLLVAMIGLIRALRVDQDTEGKPKRSKLTGEE